ncbi:MAG: Nif3-like dinuclear metal center hexameric protein [Bacteroidales bacterium]|nr:Nif3-like dinuclear metal center hexameric protein [Bacteroidales bacterium]MDD3891504.1 Nif3-like dinuclear metal center hexameric protein [Bacteroidales bacterium]
MTVKDIAALIEEFAPLGYQESYDNAGLIVGYPTSKVNRILLCVDVTPEVLDEALAKEVNLIIAHHPLIFSGIKRLTGANYTEQTIIKAIKHNIAIYSAHTNLDSVWNGVSMVMAKKVELQHTQILSPIPDNLVKLAVFVPKDHAEQLRLAMFDAGAGKIGDYDQCSYNTTGIGTFRAGENTNPFVGNKDEMHLEEEIKVEVAVPKPILSKVVSSILKVHPYEEVAYDIFPLLNTNPRAGLGAVGQLPKPQDEAEFLKKIKMVFNASCIRHTKLLGKPIERVALCGGSGASLIKNAINAKADIFITADVKYHNFFDAENKIVIADIGHFESEQLTIDIFYELLTKKLPNFAILKTKVNTNPINYI